MRAACLILLVCLCACSAPDPSIRQSDVTIPMVDAAGRNLTLAGRVCRPMGEAPARAIIIAHGSPPSASARPMMDLQECDSETTRFFTTRGYVVVYALRRGYGASDGNWAEGYGRCDAPDYVNAGLSTARDLMAVVNFATSLPYALPDRAVVIGQSAGGWGTMALDARSHPKVAGLIVMAGGRGGHRDGIANNNCAPQALIDAAGHYGQTARTPMLWIYARNDSYFAPDLASAMEHAFTQAGGDVTFVQPQAYADDGHKEFFGEGGSVNWGAPVLRYLQAQGLGAR